MSTRQSQPGSLILIVDDNPANLRVLGEALVNAGYAIAVATDGAMALEQVKYEQPSLILLDIKMPGLDGYEVFQRLHATPEMHDIPVIFMTAVSETAEKVRALRLGAVDYITKPFQQEEVLARVQVHLKLRSLTRAVEERNTLLEKEISERAAAEAAIESLNRTLEQRVEERTAELSRTLDELKRAQGQVETIVRAAGDELRRANEALEGEVARRTEELRQAKERLELELAQRERSEEARAALQREVFEVQNRRLAELSTPLIPITDEIMVMPLIGTMDQQRASQVLETALAGAATHHARAVIIDITGVKLVDASIAGTLLRVAEALRLLGANTVITGIRPDVAQALVGMDLDLRQVVTMGTLQSGIAYALGGKLR